MAVIDAIAWIRRLVSERYCGQSQRPTMLPVGVQDRQVTVNVGTDAPKFTPPIPAGAEQRTKRTSISSTRLACTSRHLAVIALLALPVGTAASADSTPPDAADSSHSVEADRGGTCSYGYQRVDGACEAVRVPQNAHVGASGDDWECDRGYRRASGGCVRIEMPANAHLTDFSYDKGWECDPGFLDEENICSPMRIPEHAYSAYRTFGLAWECERGFRQEGDRCLPVEIPPHGYLSASGHEWRCERGYFPKGHLCVALVLPSHAHVDDSGNLWECDPGYRRTAGSACTPIPSNSYPLYGSGAPGWHCKRGYRAEGDTCVAVKVPEHAFLNAWGNDWQCERGFTREGQACVAISVPLNAHIDASGNGWQCNWGFSAQHDECVASGSLSARRDQRSGVSATVSRQ